MSAGRDIIIGAGHNGLVTACLLARAGLKPLVLERRGLVGGAAVTEEIHAGFRCPTLLHATSSPMRGLIQELDLARYGLEPIHPDVRVFSPSRDGRGIAIYEDPERTAHELAGVSSKDSAAFAEFARTMRTIGGFLRPILSMTPPSIESPGLSEILRLLGVGARFRGLGSKNGFRLLRWGPMAVADFAAEWFETELLKATVASRGIFGSFAGPWSAGTTLGLLQQAAYDGHAVAPSISFRNGIGSLGAALAAAAAAAGAEIRTTAPVARITSKDGIVDSVVLEGGEVIPARCVISSADPKTTFLRLVDSLDLPPDFVHKMRNYRSQGVSAKVNYALSGLPVFSGAPESTRGVDLLRGRIHIGPEIDYLERAFDAAKYGGFSPRPVLDVAIPSLSDPTLAPQGGHVMSVYAQYAPHTLKGSDWAAAREGLAQSVEETLVEFAPNLRSLIVHRQVLTPADIEATFGLSGGHILHGEQAIDQLFTMRPLLGWARYRTPLKGLYLCGSGTHPGGGITGGPGANAAREILKELKR